MPDVRPAVGGGSWLFEPGQFRPAARAATRAAARRLGARAARPRECRIVGVHRGGGGLVGLDDECGGIIGTREDTAELAVEADEAAATEMDGYDAELTG